MRALIAAACWILGGCGDVVIAYGDTDGVAGTVGASVGTATDATAAASDAGTSGADDSTGADARLPDYVAAGFFETIAVSFDDGRTWQEVAEPQSPVEVTHEGIAAGPDRVVIVGGASTLVSTDGLTWDAYGDQLGYARAVAYGDGTFISVGLDRRARSDDAIGWIDERQDLTDFDVQAIAYGNGRFVAVGLDLMMTTTDGITWEETAVDGPKLGAIEYGNGVFVAAGAGGHTLVTANGVDVLLEQEDGIEYSDVCFFDGEFALLSGGVVRVSEDGQEWREFAVPMSSSFACGPASVVALSLSEIRRGDDLLSLSTTATASGDLERVAFTGR